MPLSETDVVLSSALQFARAAADTPEELAEILETSGEKLIEAAKVLLSCAAILERLETCRQTGCDEPPVFCVEFPGSDKPTGICAKHAPWACAVYDALGYRLRLDPIEEVRERLRGSLR